MVPGLFLNCYLELFILKNHYRSTATKNQTFFVLIFPEKSFFRKKHSSRLLFLL